MKKILIGLFATSLLLSCNSGTPEAEATETSVKECDANDVVSAAKCLCNLYEIEDALTMDDGDEAYEKATENTDKFNEEIDKAIADGKYTEQDLSDAASDIGCDI